MLLTTSIIFGYGLKTLRANHRLFLVLTTSQSIQDSLADFNLAINQTLTGKFEARQQLYEFAYGLNQSQNILESDLLKASDFAINELKKSIAQEPKNVSAYLWLGTLFNRLSKYDSQYANLAIQSLDSALDLSPTRPQLYFQRGLSYAISGQNSLAINDYQKALNLAPWVIESHWQFLALGVAIGDFKLVDGQLSEMNNWGWRPKLQDFDRLINLYLGVKKYDRIIELYQEILAIQPSAQRYFQLAQVYAKNGDKQSAESQAKKAIGIDANLTTQIYQFLQAL